MSNSGKSAVGPGECRLTLSSRPSATSSSRALSTLRSRVLANTLLLRSSHSGQSTALDDFLRHVLMPAMLPALSCSLPVSFFHAQITALHSHQSEPFASDTSDLARSVPFHHSAILASLAYTSSTRALGCSCKKCLPMIIVSCTLRCALACTVFLCQFGSSFHRDRVTCGRVCMALFQSRVLFDVLVEFAPIFLSSLVPTRSHNCPSSRLVVMSMMRVESMP